MFGESCWTARATGASACKAAGCISRLSLPIWLTQLPPSFAGGVRGDSLANSAAGERRRDFRRRPGAGLGRPYAAISTFRMRERSGAAAGGHSTPSRRGGAYRRVP